MGSGLFKSAETGVKGNVEEVEVDGNEPNNPHLRWIDENKDFESEDSLIYTNSPLYMELRSMLEEPLGQHYLAEFAKSENSHENFLAWIDMQEFKRIPTNDYRRTVAKNIFQKYIKSGAVMQLGGLNEESICELGTSIYGSEYFTTGDARNTSKGTIPRGNTSGNIAQDAQGEPQRQFPGSFKRQLTTVRGRLDLQQNLFQKLQNLVFREMAENTFRRFKATAQYNEYIERKKNTYNRVNVDDFEYLSFLGKGAFGLVAHVRKKSTGKHYAMKVMSKHKLVRSLARRGAFDERRRRICIERDVYAQCRFPFIVEMHYAFQIKEEAMIVMEFARGGTLDDLIKSHPDKILPEDHVRFIVAELALSLRHMHCMNYVHRDLKPGNVLLDKFGHVKLADMGLVGQIDDTKDVVCAPTARSVLQKRKTTRTLGEEMGEYSESLTTDDDDDDDDDDEEEEEEEEKAPDDGKGSAHQDKVMTIPKLAFVGRRYTKVGTSGYKAPELLRAVRPRKRSKTKRGSSAGDAYKSKTATEGEAEEPVHTGYGASVDWWSLGVMVLEMVCGKNHLAPKNNAIFQTVEPERAEINIIESLQVPSSKIPKDNVTQACRDFVDGLLQVDPSKRLGTNAEEFRGIRKHAWFADLDFSRVLGKEIKPPFKAPERKENRKEPGWNSFELMKLEVEAVDLGALVGEQREPLVREKDQKYFKEWDYVAKETFKLELGAQEKLLGL